MVIPNFFQAARISQHKHCLFPGGGCIFSHPIGAKKFAVREFEHVSNGITDCSDGAGLASSLDIMIEDVKNLHRVAP